MADAPGGEYVLVSAEANTKKSCGDAATYAQDKESRAEPALHQTDD